jgi:hypothetical protein
MASSLSKIAATAANGNNTTNADLLQKSGILDTMRNDLIEMGVHPDRVNEYWGDLTAFHQDPDKTPRPEPSDYTQTAQVFAFPGRDAE